MDLPGLCQANTSGLLCSKQADETHGKVIVMAQLDSPEIPVSP